MKIEQLRSAEAALRKTKDELKRYAQFNVIKMDLWKRGQALQRDIEKRIDALRRVA